MNNNNSRAKIKKLIHFIAENETLFFPKDGNNNLPQTQLTLGTHLLFSHIHKAPPSQSQQYNEKTIHIFLRQHGHSSCSSDVKSIGTGIKTDSPSLYGALILFVASVNFDMQ
ncbi:hypothetical protein AVEN_174207-1 [Araneus ventricosus]|uniref:Uncharacterized protein n=1 Tax=Araneus ventricosus TaxID=182803 RepID=A0A4Y2WSW3_ARAVE|nr:hypothetical protein AVEN_174206-1 [Araneus ventricosus]GBO40493.1 hypothetical protein AVEN_174207-1 [Araneus ventricosus]